MDIGSLPTWRYKDEIITLVGSGLFSINAGEDSQPYESLRLAKEAIDRALADRAIELREGMAFAALTHEGKPCTITGIRRGTGAFLFTGATKDVPLYPYTPKICELLRRKQVADQESRRLSKMINNMEIAPSYGRYRQQNDSEYPASLALFKSDYAAALARAEKIDLG